MFIQLQTVYRLVKQCENFPVNIRSFGAALGQLY